MVERLSDEDAAMQSRRVLITGAARRVGAICAQYLHARGCRICIHYRSSEREASRLCRQLNDLRADSARIFQADLLDLAQLQVMAEAVHAAWGGLDVLVNNASAFYPTEISAVTEGQWDDLLGSNLKAPFFLAKAFSRSLEANKGCIVNIIDIHAERGLQGFPVYSIAKAGLAAMTRVLAKELAPAVRVNAVSPGAILWPEHALGEDEKRDILTRVALQRSGSPEDIAKAVAFLVMDGDYITGQVIAVDGGRTLYC